jgi:hypothetical protein
VYLSSLCAVLLLSSRFTARTLVRFSNSPKYFVFHVFLTSALVGGERSASRPGRFTPEERTPDTHWIGVWVDPRAGLDDMKK